MVRTPEQVGEAHMDYQGDLIGVEKKPMRIGEKEVTFETAVRPPGTRAIIDNGQAILITKEYRYEQDDYDYRLPGGKIFDTLKEYLDRRGEDMIPYAKDAVKRECEEEVGITATSIEYFARTSPTSTIEAWLSYFIITEFEGTPKEQNTEEGEHIIPEWVPYQKVSRWCLDATIGEEFSALMLLRYLH